MTFRSARAALVVPIALAVFASPARAQAWLPAQGEGSVSVLFQDMLVKNHYFGTEPFDGGRIRSESMVLDVTYGVTDRVAISAALPLVASKFTGDPVSPFAAPHPQPLYPGVNPLDDGSYHALLQDFRFNVRYNLVKTRGFALTPFIGSIVPSHDYEVFAHAAPGRDLNELSFGLSAAKVFESRVPGVFLQVTYFYGVAQQILNIPHNHSNASLEVGYFVTPKLRVIGLSSGQITHGGIDGTPALGFDPVLFPVHDQITHDNYLDLGGGFAYSMSDKIDLFGSLIHAMSFAQRNGHQMDHGLTVGLSWTFATSRAHDRTIASTEGALARCVCEKGTK
jgi:hypothetical protein